LTHNTKECHRYDGNGNPMAAAGHKPGGAKPSSKSGGDRQMAYLTAAVESVMKKGLKKAMKSKNVSAIALTILPAVVIPIPNRKLGAVTWSR
jgi:hypothetical protein